MKRKMVMAEIDTRRDNETLKDDVTQVLAAAGYVVIQVQVNTMKPEPAIRPKREPKGKRRRRINPRTNDIGRVVLRGKHRA